MYRRFSEQSLKKSALSNPSLAILGPRQSGKTTLAKACFPHLPYVSLEDPDTRQFATEDPRGFLENYPNGAIFDEVQRTPEIFSYLQSAIDKDPKPGKYILTGSHNFLLMENITQSLAGRININTLLPLTLSERPSFEKETLSSAMLKGFYPRPFAVPEINRQEWFADYIRTYVERDVREMKNIDNLSTFTKFLKFCAGRAGQLLNLSSLGDDCGISHNTAKAWISVLEASYIVFLLEPNHNNFNKRLKKSSKLYFYDTGLLCHLIGIHQEDVLSTHPLRGAIFENLIIADLFKRKHHEKSLTQFSFWQDQAGHEIDLILEQGLKTSLVEIKSGMTISSDSFKNLDYWRKLAKSKSATSHLVYGGEQNQDRSAVKVLSWRTPDFGIEI